ncbi:hypothetical protein GCM10010264_43210 [Streptomyces globisporus]|nr:hypothetical protein GCM10010264_43210 [Streptomyces globisporus]
MPPPPPPLGRSRRRGSRSDHVFDPALDDDELIAARGQFVQGRWSDARTLLVATGRDWDRRGHRVLALAETSSAEDWAGDWLLVEPESADAAVLLACARVVRALRPKARANDAARAREACLAAARLPPRTPPPGSRCSSWTGAATTARTRPAGSSRRCAPATPTTTTPTM